MPDTTDRPAQTLAFLLGVIQMTDKQREKFEAWVFSNRPMLFLHSRDDGSYRDPKTQALWLAWLAAIASFEITLPAPATEIIPGARYYFNDDVVMTLEAAGVGVKS